MKGLFIPIERSTSKEIQKSLKDISIKLFIDLLA
jgi:hypothetical protein